MAAKFTTAGYRVNLADANGIAGPDQRRNVMALDFPWFGKVKTLQLKYGAPYIP